MSTLSIEELKQALTHYEARQADDGVWEIELHLASVTDAVRTLVPVPLPYVDLDADVAAYIADQLESVPKDAKFRLVIRLPEQNIHEGDEQVVQTVLGLYVEQKLKRYKKQERAALRDVISAFFWGVAFMLLCQILRWLLAFPEYPTITQTISEGLLVLGWVALWNPYDRFLFSWLPALKNLKSIRRMKNLQVQIKPSRYDLMRGRARGAGANKP